MLGAAAAAHWPEDVPAELRARLVAAGYGRPTPIQGQALSRVLEGGHVAIHSPTGTGKTLAFVVPALARLSGAHAGDDIRVLVVTPTVELAVQLGAVVEQLCDRPPLVLAQDGVQDLDTQRRALDGYRGPVLVGTAKQLRDVLGQAERRWARLARLATVVLDEVDLMLPPTVAARAPVPQRAGSRGSPPGKRTPIRAGARPRVAGGGAPGMHAAERRLAQRRPIEQLLAKLASRYTRSGEAADAALARSPLPQLVLASATLDRGVCERVAAAVGLPRGRRARPDGGAGGAKRAAADSIAASQVGAFTVAGADAPHSNRRLVRRGAASVTLPSTIRHVAYLVKDGPKSASMLGVLAALAELSAEAPVVVIPDDASVRAAVDALRDGGFPSAVALHRVLGLGDHERAAAAGGDVLSRARVQRGKLANAFARRAAVPLVVTTESAARGLDLHAVDAVIVQQLPRSVDAYVHLAGRTGRQGRRGTVVSIVPPARQPVIATLRRELGITIEEVDLRMLMKTAAGSGLS